MLEQKGAPAPQDTEAELKVESSLRPDLRDPLGEGAGDRGAQKQVWGDVG